MSISFFKKNKKKNPDEDYEDIFRSEELWEDPSKKGLKGFFNSLTSQGASVLIFAASFLLLLAGIIISAAAGGSAGLFLGFLGIVSLAGALYGAGVALYGRFVVKSKSKLSWLWGLILNLVLAVFLLIVYIAGAV